MRKLVRRFCYWLRPRRAEADLAEEIEFHRAMRQKRLEESGLSVLDAAFASRRELGNIALAREDARAIWIWPWIESVWQDARHGARGLVRNPGFSVITVLILALGIGANTAIFSVLEAVLLRPLPGADPSRLVLLLEHSAQVPTMMVSYPDYLDWQSSATIFTDVAVFNQFRSMTLLGGDTPERVRVALVTSNLGRTIGLAPALGRGFREEEDRPGAPRTVILGHDFWQTHFNGDPGALGKPLVLDNETYTVVGVLPEAMKDFPYPRGAALWLPYGLFVDQDVLNRGNHPGLGALGRLKPGASLDQTRAQLSTIAERLAHQYPATNNGVGVTVTPVLEASVGYFRPTLYLLLGAVGLVLLIVCANVTNLLLVRSAGRRRELAFRSALGAGRIRLVRASITEHMVLSLAGAAAGIGVAYWGTGLLRSLGQNLIPRSAGMRVDVSALAFSLGLALLVGALVSLLPGFLAGRTGTQDLLKENSRGSDSRRGRGIRSALVIAEIAVSAMLLVGAILLLRSLIQLQSQLPGFATEHVITCRLNPPAVSYGDKPALARLYQEVLGRIAHLPGIEAAGAVSPLPFSGEGWQAGITVEGVPEPTPGDNPMVDAASISPDYFRAMQIPLLRGRGYSERDSAAAPLTVIVNQAFVQRFWPAANPLGRRIHMGPASAPEPWRTVVGVVGNVKHVGLQSPPTAEVFFPLPQQPQRAAALVVRTAGDPARIVPALRGAVSAVDSTLPIYGVATTAQLVDNALSQPRFSTFLLGLLALIALILAAVGVYGVMAYAVARQTKELGIRIALGAQPSDILRLVLGHGLRIAALGLALGMAAAFALTRYLATLLFDVRPGDPLTFILAASALAIVAFLACYLPTRRAVRVDPIAALRCE